MDLVVFLAPGNNLYKYGCQVGPLWCELIKYLSLAIRMLGLRDNASTFEQDEPVGKDIRSDALPSLQKITICVESLKHNVPDNEQRPFVSKDVQGCTDRAV